MRTIIWVLMLIVAVNGHAQNWSTFAGNNEKNGLTKHNGPVNFNEVYWSINNSMDSYWGNAIYTFGDKFATARTSLSPYLGKIELRNLFTGDLIWEKAINSSSRMYVIGFNEDAVYACDYYNNNATTVYALDVATGNTKWSYAMPVAYMFPGFEGVCFTDDGDPIIRGIRLNRLNGSPKWTNNYVIPYAPNGGFVVNLKNNTYYHWTGYFTQDQKLIAIDVSTGVTKFLTDFIEGDGDQENYLILGPDGTLYLNRDGGGLYAFTDNGSSLVQKWVKTEGVQVKSFGPDHVLYCADINNGMAEGPLMRVNGLTGEVIDYATPSVIARYVTVGADSTVYVCSGEAENGKMYAYTYDLQTQIWQLDVPFNYYSGCPIGKEGVFIVSGQGTVIKSYKRNINRKPVADFRSSGRDMDLTTNHFINYFDQSSYNPTSWQWFFEGGSPNTSTEQNPTNISYSEAGIYQVKLIASNAFGSDTIIRTKYIFATGINGLDEKTFKNSTLGQNYPNPFSTSTTISVGLNEPAKVTIKVFDLFGKEVSIIIDDQYFEAGSNEVVFYSEGLTPGIYMYTLELNNYIVATKKLTILK